MKHRSTHIFILVAALLVAAPRFSQELSALKDDLGRRLKSEIFGVYLSLHSTDATRPAPVADGLTASAAAPAARPSAAPARVATQVEVHARREVPAEAAEEVAAITEPVIELAAAAATAASVAPASVPVFELHDQKVIRGRELAMIIPPDADVTAPPPPARPQTVAARKAHTPRRRAAVPETRAAFEVQFDDAVEFTRLDPEQLRRQFEQMQTLRFDADAARTRTTLIKMKRTAPKQAPPAPPARAACPETRAEPAPALQVGCGPTAVETFYSGE